MVNALIVGSIVAFLWAIEKLFGTPMVIRPLVVSPIVGYFLGDLQTGVLIGATLELVFMGAIQIGGAVPPDILVGSSIATALAIIGNNKDPDIALGLALPIALLAQSLKIIVFILRSYMMNTAMKFAENADMKNLIRLNYFGLFIQCFMYFIVCFLAILLGQSFVDEFLKIIPGFILEGLKVAGGLLPAVGFALLLQPIMNKKNYIYFILGFSILAYTKLPIMAITIFAIVLAYVVVYENKTLVTCEKKDYEEDLFDA